MCYILQVKQEREINLLIMKAYKLTFQTKDFEGKTSTFKTTAYDKDQIEEDKAYHAERGAELIDVKDISIK